MALICSELTAMDKDKWDLRVRDDVDRIYDKIITITNIPQNSKKIVMLVEGYYDKRFYDKFIRKTNVLTIYTNGCERMNALAEILRTNGFEYLAIQDSDFSKLGAVNTGMVNMFFTDFHDYEMTCIGNGKVWSKVDSKLELSVNGISKSDVFNDIELLSYYRYCSRLMDFYNSFTIVKKRVCDTNVLNYDFVHKHIDDSHPQFKDIQEGYLNGFMTNHPTAKTDAYNFHNGHDFINRLVFKLNQDESYLYYDCDEEEIQDVIVDSTDLSDFQSTDLYKDVATWSTSHKGVFK